jgi:hypothetical protein
MLRLTKNTVIGSKLQVFVKGEIIDLNDYYGSS